MRSRLHTRAHLLALLWLIPLGCASGGISGEGTPPGPGALESGAGSQPSLPPGIHWVRTAAEHRAIFEQTYGWAEAAVREGSRSRDPGSWGVILDADETLLDNSEYQVRRARVGLGYTRESWNEWVREETARLLPGAGDFVETVKALGGHVFVVTNRDEEVCDPTRRNLAALGIAATAVLCRNPGEEGKEARFRRIESGRATSDVGPITVIVWVGDNIRDFPGMSQEVRTADPSRLDGFGTRYFILPNPMYGSWESNPPGTP